MLSELCAEFGCLPSEIEKEDWLTVMLILQCRRYRRAAKAYEEGKPTHEQGELLAEVDQWRRESED